MSLLCISFLAFLGQHIGGIVQAQELGPDFGLESGATVRQAGQLIGRGLALRKEAVSDQPDAPAIRILADSLDTDMPAQTAVVMLRFFMNGAVPLAMPTANGDYIIFVNPVADVALITSWQTGAGNPQIKQSRLVTLETLEGVEHQALTARWTDVEQMADLLVEIVQNTLKNTPNPSPDYISRIETLLKDTQDKHPLPFRRMAAAVIGASPKAAVCSDAIVAASKRLKTLASQAESTNIPANAPDAELAVAGGIAPGRISLLVLSNKERPGDFIFVAADKDDNCKIFAANGVSTLIQVP